MKTTNILLANWTWYPSGGDWTTVENLSKLYRQKGHKIIPFAMKDPRNYPTPYERYFVDHIDYKELNKQRSLKNAVTVLRRSVYSKESRRRLKQLLDDVDVDIAHLHNLGPQITPSILSLLKARGIPIIWTLHDYGILCPAGSFVSNGRLCEKCMGRKFYQCTINKCKKNSYLASFVASLRAYVLHLLKVYDYVDFFICPSQFLINKFEEYGFDKNRLVQIHNPYDVSEIRTINGNDDVPYSDYILYVGRIERIKGVFSLLEAMRTIRSVNLLLVGSGEEDGACRNFIRDKHLPNIHFLGQKGKETVISLIRNCLFTVCPSECYENLPYSVIEAMVMGKPVIGAEIGGIPELVRDGVTGLTFEPGNVTELRDKVAVLASDKSRQREYGENARKHVIELVDFQAHYRKMEDIFRKVKGD